MLFFFHVSVFPMTGVDSLTGVYPAVGHKRRTSGERFLTDITLIRAFPSVYSDMFFQTTVVRKLTPADFTFVPLDNCAIWAVRPLMFYECWSIREWSPTNLKTISFTKFGKWNKNILSRSGTFQPHCIQVYWHGGSLKHWFTGPLCQLSLVWSQCNSCHLAWRCKVLEGHLNQAPSTQAVSPQCFLLTEQAVDPWWWIADIIFTKQFNKISFDTKRFFRL
jgi:hypothetical protein